MVKCFEQKAKQIPIASETGAGLLQTTRSGIKQFVIFLSTSQMIHLLFCLLLISAHFVVSNDLLVAKKIFSEDVKKQIIGAQ